MDIFEELHQEHDKVDRMLTQLSTSGRDEDMFEQMRSDLTSHSLAEEQVFYSRLEDEPETRDLIREGVEEHRMVMQLLEDLESAEDDDEWSDQLQVLTENVQHHVQEEEGTLFPQARQIISDDEAQTLCDEFEEAKRDIAA